MSERQLNLADFDYSFPEDLVAQWPLTERDASKLLVRGQDGELRHSRTRDLVSELKPNSLLVMNDSKVAPSRIFGHITTGAKIELLLLEEVLKNSDKNATFWRAIGKPLKKLKVKSKIAFEAGLEIEVIEINASEGGVEPILIKTNMNSAELSVWLEHYGIVPLPPYIRRDHYEKKDKQKDLERYQTVYAKSAGSAAAPTAGLHFSANLLKNLKAANIETCHLTLHVGTGTFLPVKSNDLANHRMHSERFVVEKEALQAIARANREGRDIIAVGTTSLRCLESFYLQSSCNLRLMEENCGKILSTDLFVYPKNVNDIYKPWALSGLMTNFHQPQSTLLMLVSALVGVSEIKKCYDEAIRERYRLFSYGDACLLWF